MFATATHPQVHSISTPLVDSATRDIETGDTADVHSFETDGVTHTPAIQTWHEYGREKLQHAYRSLPSREQVRAQITPKNALTGLVALLLIGRDLRLSSRVSTQEHMVSCINYSANDKLQLQKYRQEYRTVAEKVSEECNPTIVFNAQKANAAWTALKVDKDNYKRQNCKDKDIASTPEDFEYIHSRLRGAKAKPKTEKEKVFKEYIVTGLSHTRQTVAALHDAANPGSDAAIFTERQIAKIDSDFAELGETPRKVPCP